MIEKIFKPQLMIISIGMLSLNRKEKCLEYAEAIFKKLKSPTKVRNQASKLIADIYDNREVKLKFVGVSPRRLATATVYISYILNGVPIAQKEITKVGGCAAPTLRRIYKRIFSELKITPPDKIPYPKRVKLLNKKKSLGYVIPRPLPWTITGSEQEFSEWFERNQKEFGFKILKRRRHFPDYIVCDKDGKKLRVELETASSNFYRHRHPKDGVDLVVCKEKDIELPVPTLEVGELYKRTSPQVDINKDDKTEDVLLIFCILWLIICLIILMRMIL